MNPVSSTEEIAANIAVFDRYRTSEKSKHRLYFSKRLRLGKIFVYGTLGRQFLFAPSRFAGYSQCTVEKHEAFLFKDGKVTTPKISRLLGKPVSNAKAETAYIALCNEIGVIPSAKNRTYWFIELTDNLVSATVPGGETGFPDEVGRYIEGATKRVLVNAYERSERARSACLNHYGYDCSVCRFNFKSEFGEVGNKFMHVHHEREISTQGGAYSIDPIKDLKPVCPNCHAMLHQSDPPFTIEQLRKIRDAAKDA
jgi:5-methylcytosine-specific restriction enzyme A